LKQTDNNLKPKLFIINVSGVVNNVPMDLLDNPEINHIDQLRLHLKRLLVDINFDNGSLQIKPEEILIDFCETSHSDRPDVIFIRITALHSHDVTYHLTEGYFAQEVLMPKIAHYFERRYPESFVVCVIDNHKSHESYFATTGKNIENKPNPD